MHQLGGFYYIWETKVAKQQLVEGGKVGWQGKHLACGPGWRTQRAFGVGLGSDRAFDDQQGDIEWLSKCPSATYFVVIFSLLVQGLTFRNLVHSTSY